MKPDEKEAENIRVAVRCRPMNEREIREQAVSCFTAENGNAVLTNLENPSEKHQFGYDFVYGCDSFQESVFLDIGVPILDRAFGGYNGTIFAYGQTGSGKTFSMSGVSGNETLEGLIPRMNKSIFDRIQIEKQQHPNKLFLVECSFFEIYNEIIYDLLDSSGNGKKNKGGLEIKEHSVLGIYVKDLQERVVDSREEVIDLMAQGASARTVGYTQMNSESSRSHSIFVIKIHQKDSEDESKNIFAKINLVDLAGSERAASTGAQGDRLKEGANINKSLSALGNVINALVEASRMGKKVFIPYRNSKLTRVLQESLGGNSLCSMLATLSPANINYPETLSTLKYASRAKSIKVNAKKNEASSQISQLNEEIAALKKKLTEQTEVTLGLDPKEKDDIVKAYEKQIQEMDRIRLQTWEDKAKLSKQHELERKRLAKEKALADQKIREERTRKWKLLEEKGDIELMLRALRDLDRSPSGVIGATGCSSTEERWLEKAAKMKALESESKDHRTLIMVFKDSLHKDVDQWGKRVPPDGKTGGDSTKRDDSAASFHMTASQLCNKLQNIHQESTQLLTLEHQLVCESNGLINDMTSEIIRFKEHRTKLKATATKPLQTAAAAPLTLSTPATITTKPTTNAAKEVEQVLEEREKGLAITLAMVQAQRASLVAFVKSERKRVFNFAEVTTQFTKCINQHITSSSSAPITARTDSVSAGPQSDNENIWQQTKQKVLAVSDKWKKYWEGDGNQTSSHADSDSTALYVPKGEVAPLGMESKLIYDESLVVSSKKPDAKSTRMNCAQYWIPDEQDQAPSLLVDLELPRFFHSISIKGGCFNGTAGVPHPSSNVKGPADGASKPSSENVVSTFVLKPTEDLRVELSKHKLAAVSGEHESAHEILGNVISWIDLLKTMVIPAKLFARPPVRFLHDVISMVIQNTGFAAQLFSASEKDYSQLVSKTERADFLTKILDHVQEMYRKRHEGESTGTTGTTEPNVIIAATASNILAGKEPTDTLKFLSYFALIAMEHAVQHRPATPVSATSVPAPPASNREPEAKTGTTPRATEGDETTSPEVSSPEKSAGDDKKLRDCWVKKIRVTTSLNGKDWHPLGDFEANADAVNVKTITLEGANNQQQQASQAGVVGRYIKITCVEWNDLPLFQAELLGQEASEGDSLVKSLEALGDNAIALLQQLSATASLLLEDAKLSWEKAKDVEREKQEELTNLGEELVAVKKKCEAFEKEVSDLKQSQAQLQQGLHSEVKKFGEEKVKNEKLQKELQQAVVTIDEVKKKNEALEVKLGEQNHTIQTLTLQQSEQKKTMLTLDQSKLDLEKLCSNLQSQLQNRDQQEGHQESKIASMYGELMSANVQVEEFKRKLETSEQMRQEQEAFDTQLHAQLQQNRVAMGEKEKALEESMKQKQKVFEDTIEALQAEKDQLKKSVELAVASESKLKSASLELETQVKAIQVETEAWKRKLKDAEVNVSTAAATAAASTAAASAEAGEKLLLEAQTKELRCLAEIEKIEAKVQAFELKQKEAEAKVVESEQERQSLLQKIAALEETEEEMQLQLQVVTEERDSARQKEEQLFAENNEKEQEIERIRDGYGMFLILKR